MKSSLIQRIFKIVLFGSFIGAIFVGIMVYFILISSGINMTDALIKAIISVAISQIMFLFPVFIIRKIIKEKIVDPINKVVKALHEVSMGNLDFEIKVYKTGDELEDLTESFERMRLSMKAIMEKLEKGEF